MVAHHCAVSWADSKQVPTQQPKAHWMPQKKLKLMEENVVHVQFYKMIPHWLKNYITRNYKVSLFVFFLQIPYPRLLATFGDRKPGWIDLGSVFFTVKNQRVGLERLIRRKYSAGIMGKKRDKNGKGGNYKHKGE